MTPKRTTGVATFYDKDILQQRQNHHLENQITKNMNKRRFGNPGEEKMVE